MHGCVISTVATDVLVLKHQAISIHNADKISVVVDQLHTHIFLFQWKTPETKIIFWKKWPDGLRVKEACDKYVVLLSDP